MTGASGFVGSAVVEKLHASKEYVPIAAMRNNLDLCSADISSIKVSDLCADLDWSVALRDVDAVIHTAARVHVMKDSELDPLTEYRKVNVEGTLSLARQASTLGVKRFIYINELLDSI